MAKFRSLSTRSDGFRPRCPRAGERRGRHVRVALAGHHVVELFFRSFFCYFLRARSAFLLASSAALARRRRRRLFAQLLCDDFLGLRRDGLPTLARAASAARELAARQRRDGAVVLAVDGVLALASARGEAHARLAMALPVCVSITGATHFVEVLSLRLCGLRLWISRTAGEW